MSGIECALTARLGRDAELRLVKGGALPPLSFNAAVEDSHAAEDAPAAWVRVAVFGDRAEELVPRLLKGTRVYVEGRLTAELWAPDDIRPPRVNLNVAASLVQPIGQIGRQRPQQPRRDLPVRGKSTRAGARDGRTAVHRNKRRADARQACVEELAARFDARDPDEVPL